MPDCHGGDFKMIQNNQFPDLKIRAQKMLGGRCKSKPIVDHDVYQLIEELALYQAELEVQNEDLIKIQIELSESRNKYIDLYEFAPIGYFTFNPDGLIIELNHAGAKLLGMQKNELINRCFSRYIAPEYQAIFSQYRLRVIKEVSSYTYELKLLRWSGPSFYAQLESKMVEDSSTGDKHVLTFITDITHRKHTEESLHQQQIKMAAIDRMRSMNELVSTLAQEQNHAITMINNYVYGCIRRFETGKYDVAEMLNAMKNIEKQARNLAEIILRMKNFTSKGSFRYELANINTLVKETLSLANYEMLGFFVTVYCEYNAELPELKLDKSHIQQVILNLARNSIEAMRDARICEPKLVIEITLSNTRANTIEIGIFDNGPGLSNDIRDKLFEPYFTTKSYGLGLGLTVSRTIVEKHGGELIAQSNYSGGACFRFTLPCVSVVKSALVKHPS
jgi:PAS domain S-box-containing protein